MFFCCVKVLFVVILLNVIIFDINGLLLIMVDWLNLIDKLSIFFVFCGCLIIKLLFFCMWCNNLCWKIILIVLWIVLWLVLYCVINIFLVGNLVGYLFVIIDLMIVCVIVWYMIKFFFDKLVGVCKICVYKLYYYRIYENVLFFVILY